MRDRFWVNAGQLAYLLVVGAYATVLHAVLLLNPLWFRGRWLEKFYSTNLPYVSLVSLLL